MTDDDDSFVDGAGGGVVAGVGAVAGVEDVDVGIATCERDVGDDCDDRRRIAADLQPWRAFA